MWPLSGENGPSRAWPWNEVRQTSPDPQLTASCGWVARRHSRGGMDGRRWGGKAQFTFVANYHPSKRGTQKKTGEGGLSEERKGFYTPVLSLKKKKERTTDRSRDERKDLWLERTDSSWGWRQLTVEKKHEYRVKEWETVEGKWGRVDCTQGEEQ